MSIFSIASPPKGDLVTQIESAKRRITLMGGNSQERSDRLEEPKKTDNELKSYLELLLNSEDLKPDMYKHVLENNIAFLEEHLRNESA